MGQRSIRFPDELEARLAVLAAADGRTFSNYVLRTLEKALDTGSPGEDRTERPAPPRPSAKSDPPSERELQGVRNVLDTTLDTMQEVAANRRRNRMAPVDTTPRLGKGFVPPRPKGT